VRVGAKVRRTAGRTKAKAVRLKVPKLRKVTFKTAIIEQYRRRESSVEEALTGNSDISTTRKYYLAVRPKDMVSANKMLNSILAGAYDN
jgi:transposase-like protein